MNFVKERAIDMVNKLHNNLPYDAYSVIHDGLTEIELLRDRDTELEELWERFGDIPMNPETECIEEPFMGWGVGIHREEIWDWFDKRHSKGVYYLLYGISATQVNKVYELMVNWSADYEGQCETSVFRTKRAALKAMQEEIDSATQDYDVFDDTTKELIDDDWVLEKKADSWELYEDGYWSRNHCLITVTEKKVIEEELK